MGPDIRMKTVLEGDQLPGYEGIRGSSVSRSPWDFDDAASFLKYSLCQIEFDRREAIAGLYDDNHEITRGSLPDVWKPLRDLAHNLLPHLKFERVDTTNKDRIQCLWSVHEHDTIVDIDDLSSGEKSVIQLFFPLIEHRVRSILRKLRGEGETVPDSSLCALIDEPELHLHPDLQIRILAYLRTLSVQEKAQFIIATHSPTIVENANSDELYLLRPAETVQEGDNQLVRIATDDEKLNLLRDLFGSTSNLTALNPLLVVEGTREHAQSRRVSDVRMYSLLGADFSKFSILPSGGKSECKALVKSLRQVLQEFAPSLGAHALLDRDLEDTDPIEENVHLLPVSMIENFLVDPHVMWGATQLVRHRIGLTNEREVEAALDEILDDLAPFEIDRRVKAALGVKVFRPKDPVSAVQDQAVVFAEALRSAYSAERADELRTLCEATVAEVRSQNRRREFFHGKRIVEEFYRRHMQMSGMSKEIFLYECARLARGREKVKRFFAHLTKTMDLD